MIFLNCFDTVFMRTLKYQPWLWFCPASTLECWTTFRVVEVHVDKFAMCVAHIQPGMVYSPCWPAAHYRDIHCTYRSDRSSMMPSILCPALRKESNGDYKTFIKSLSILPAVCISVCPSRPCGYAYWIKKTKTGWRCMVWHLRSSADYVSRGVKIAPNKQVLNKFGTL